VLSARTTRYSVVALLSASTVLAHAQSAGDRPAAAADRILALDPRWSVTFDTPPVATAGFDQEAAYVPLEGGTLIAIDLERGGVRWQIPLATTMTPATGDGMVYATSDGHVIALDQRSGASLWRTAVPGELASRVYWESGWVLASTADGELMALRAQDGQVLWRQALGAPVAVRPSASGDQLYVALDDNRLAALNVDSGAVAWTRALEQQVTGLLALEEQLLVGTRANLLHSIAVNSGRTRWRQRAGADLIGAPVADEDFIYFVAFDNVLRALNRGNGNLRWSRNLPSRPSGGAQRANDVILVPFSTTDIGAYLATTGAPSFTIRAAGELGGAPFLRDSTRATATRLVAISREGSLQGFASRFEQPAVPLGELPGARVGG
jgi:outer membrane protein assembly factor BamB